MDFLDRHVLETLIYLPMLAALVLVFVPREQKRAVRPFNRYSDLLETLKKRSHKLRVLG